MWIADLLAHGLIRSSFAPPAPIPELRDLISTCKQLVREICRHSLRIQKVFEDASIKLGSVLSDVLTASGRAMLGARIAGESNPERLAERAQGIARRKRGASVEALRGRITRHHRAMLKLHLGVIGALERTFGELDAMARIPDPGHLISWTGQCPRNDESAGMRRSAGAQERHLAEDHADHRRLGRGAGQARAFSMPSSCASVPAAAPRRRSSPSPPLTAIYFMLRDRLPYRDLRPLAPR